MSNFGIYYVKLPLSSQDETLIYRKQSNNLQ